jgi:hypothetical protein
MLTPGELERGQWVILHEDVEDKPWQESQDDNPLLALFGVSAGNQVQSPHLILAIQLPYVVACDTSTIPMRTRIWDVRKVKIMELQPEFIQSWSPQAFANGMALLNMKKTVASPLGAVPPVPPKNS